MEDEMAAPWPWKVLLLCSLCAASMGEVGAQNPPPNLTTIYSFTCCTSQDGYAPVVPPTLGANGILYGTTNSGGERAFGTVFSLAPPTSPGGAWTETVLHGFQGGDGDGVNPFTRLLIGPGGVLYGATQFGGASNRGVVFSLTPPLSPGGQWTEATLHSFGGVFANGQADGEESNALAMNAAGVLFGTTPYGGGILSDLNHGTIFALVPPASPGGSWTYDILYNFGIHSLCTVNCSPTGIVIGAGGILYGVASGVVFALAPPTTPGATWIETVIYTFPTGTAPSGTPVLGAGGILYGTASSTGSPATAVIYSLTPPGSSGGSWTEAVVHSFSAYANPQPLSLGLNNTIFGATEQGAIQGTAFVLKPCDVPGGSWTEILLHAFTGGTDGGEPTGLTIGSGGVLYGTTQIGGYGFGTVFAITE